MTVDEAFAQIERAVRGGHPAHGYLVVGGVRGMAGELAARVLRLLFGAACDLRAHPDIHHLAPEKKSRIISVDAMRTRLIEPLGATSFQGGWKAGVIHGADCLKTESANAFLKTLEEPPPRTLFLLLTEQPEKLLPTIVSRCQRVDLPDVRGRTLEEPYRTQVIDILSGDRLKTVTARAAAAARLALILEQLKALAGELVDAEREAVADDAGGEAYEALVSSRYREFRIDFANTVMSWFRDLMAMRAAPPSRSTFDAGGARTPLVNETKRSVIETRAARLTPAAAFRNIAAVEEFAQMVERSIPESAALAFLMDCVALGTEGG
ncbi:MAG: hypothetical protein ACI4Q3_10630 [Kiritimatiellia bacterium]